LGSYQTISGKYFHLISIFTPFEHPIKPLVETFFKKMVIQTFKGISVASKKGF